MDSHQRHPTLCLIVAVEIGQQSYFLQVICQEYGFLPTLFASRLDEVLQTGQQFGEVFLS